MRQIICILFFGLLVIMNSCHSDLKEKVATPMVDAPRPFTVEAIKSVNTSYSLVSRLKKHPDIQLFGNLELNFEEAILTTYVENKSLKLITITTNDPNKNIQAIYSSEKDGFFVSLFEKVGTWNKKGEFTGSNYVKTRNGILLADHYKDNKPIEADDSSARVPNPDDDKY